MNKNDEIFSEVYGCYYDAAIKILSLAVKGNLTEESLVDIADKYVYADKKAHSSAQDIVNVLFSGKKKDGSPMAISLLKTGEKEENFDTVLYNEPVLPLTLLQKRWIKSLLLNKRIKLFDLEEPEWLNGVKPLFMPDDFVYFDQDTNGDNYSDEKYINVFRTLLKAINRKHKLNIVYADRKNEQHHYDGGIPYKMEYSPKNDKFRLLLIRKIYEETIFSVLNVSQISSVEISDELYDECLDSFMPEKSEIVFELDNDNTTMQLSRAMREFSDMEKETKHLGSNIYQVSIKYYKLDEKEIVIRLMSYLPYIKVISPDDVRKQIEEKLKTQMTLNKFE